MNYVEAHHESLHKETPPINRLENSIFLICLLSSRPLLHALCYAKPCSINTVDRRSSKIDECIRRQVELSGIAFFYISLLKSQWCNPLTCKRGIKNKIYLSAAIKIYGKEYELLSSNNYLQIAREYIASNEKTLY